MLTGHFLFLESSVFTCLKRKKKNGGKRMEAMILIHVLFSSVTSRQLFGFCLFFFFFFCQARDRNLGLRIRS